MKRRNFFAALVALVTAPMTLLKGSSERCVFNPAVLEKRRKEIIAGRKGQIVVFYRNATTAEGQPDPNTYQFYKEGWNPNAFEILKSERFDDGKIGLYVYTSDDHNAITRGMIAVFQDEDVGFVSDVARGFPRDFQCIVTVTPLNWKS